MLINRRFRGPVLNLAVSMLPPDHPKRVELNDEVHARPSGSLRTPCRLSYLALLSEGANHQRELSHVRALTERFGAAPPDPGTTHYVFDAGDFRLRWERHTEFARYSIVAAGAEVDPFATPALTAVPGDWVAAIPGATMVAMHVALVRDEDGALNPDMISERMFNGNPLIGSAVASGNAIALTDFRIHADGFSRLIVQNRSMTPRQAGRVVQRLLEIDTYRVMSLLTLPVAREMMPLLSEWESELAEITDLLARSQEVDEPVLLDRLTRLQAAIESRESDNHFRFGAAAAYYDIIRRRIAELREERLPGLPTFGEFNERRLAPAMHTCEAVAARQGSMPQRMARATQLLSTRVDVERARQNQEVLASMNRRAEAQLRLQETVEGLSVAAMTYYIVGLLGYAAKGAEDLGAPLNPNIVMLASIPVVALLVAFGVRQIRDRIARSAE